MLVALAELLLVVVPGLLVLLKLIYQINKLMHTVRIHKMLTTSLCCTIAYLVFVHIERKKSAAPCD